ncbi:MAG: VWA domain-containing protein [Polyangiales bacterium]
MSRRSATLLRLCLGLAATALLAAALWPVLVQRGGPISLPLERVAHLLPGRPRGPFELLNRRALMGLALLPALALAAEASLTDLAPLQRALGVLVRASLASLLLLALARPAAVVTDTRVCTVFDVDVSDSVSDEALASFRATVEEALLARGSNEVRVVTFARRPRALEPPPPDARPWRLPAFARHEGAGAGTDFAAAVAFSYGLFPPGCIRRLVVLSDGVQTEGDVLGEAARATRLGVRVSTYPARVASPAEVAVRDLRLPERVRVNEPFDVRASVFANRPSRARVTLMQGESLNGLDGSRVVELVAGDNEVRFRSVVRAPGDVTYALRLEPLGPDRFADNNRYVATAHVPGPPTVLYVEGDAAHASYFRGALAGGDFEVETRGAREFPQTLAELERYDFVVLSDVGAEAVSQGAQAALGRYVRELGGGFMMAGGPRGFGLGGWQGTEVERLLPVRMDAERRRDVPSVALSLVIDRSGSMQGPPLLLAQSAAIAAARALGPDDLIEVVAFDSEPERVVRMQPARNRVRIENELRRLRSGGGTAIFPALDAAAQDLAVTRAVTRHVIVLTDGEGQPDEPPRLQVLADSLFADGVTVSTVGLGATVNRPLLEGIAHRGHGRSYFTADAGNLPQIFLRETNLIARSAAVEEPVQPRVASQATFLRELGGDAPYLYGYVSTRAKAEPAQVLLETDGATPEPLLARWRAGLGWSLAWTSDLKNRWAVEWIRWPRWGAFWTQLVREHMRQRQRREVGMRAEMVAGAVHVAVDAIGDDDRFENGLTSELTLRGPLPGGREERVPLRQVAPGRYEAEHPLDRYGAFTLHAVHRRDGRVVGESRGQVNHPYPTEYAVLEPDVAMLTALARSTGGRVSPPPREVWAANGDVNRHTRAMWGLPVGAAVALLVIDVFLRRVRVFDRSFKG